jgi:transcriptional regulator with XRE-family HTH domain
MPNQEVIELRNRILGVLIQNARSRTRMSRRECAAAIGVSPDRFEDYETAQRSISLPELELLSRFLEIPLQSFRSNEALSEAVKQVELPDPDSYLMLRHRVVGARLRQARNDAGRTQKDLAEILGCSASTISDYEYGRNPVSMAELEVLGRALNVPIEFFLDYDSKVGKWHLLQEQFEQFTELSPELLEFILRPINESYLEIAMKLSRMPAGTLRMIAEGLLEITY